MKANELMRDKEFMRRAKALARPSGYALERLGFKLHPTQAACLEAVFPPKLNGAFQKSRVVLRCANEVGKTRRVVTTAILYAIEVLGAFVVSSAAVDRQLKDQLIPSLQSFAHLFARDKWAFLDKSIKRYFKRQQKWIATYTAFAAKDQHRFQGFHQDAETSDIRDLDLPLLVIIDESQGVRDEILSAAEDRCNPTYFLSCGSPGDPAGGFYEMETSRAAHYKHFKLSRPECTTDKIWKIGDQEARGWLNQEDLDRIIAKYGGADNPFVRSTVFGEFSDIVENALLSLSQYDACVDNPPEWRGSGPEDKHAFCDFAAGRDKNVLAVRVGNKVWIEKKWTEKNTMAAVGEFIFMFTKLKKEHGFEAHHISGDFDGLGKVMGDRIREIGWYINEFRGGRDPRFDPGYRNEVAEAWGEGAAKIVNKAIILPNDLDFKGQILGRKAKRNSSGALELEPKEEYKSRTGTSPDEADAILGCLMPPPQVQVQRFAQTGQEWDSQQDGRGQDIGRENIPGGFWAG
jgi:hypothetical protein